MFYVSVFRIVLMVLVLFECWQQSKTIENTTQLRHQYHPPVSGPANAPASHYNPCPLEYLICWPSLGSGAFDIYIYTPSENTIQLEIQDSSPTHLSISLTNKEHRVHKYTMEAFKTGCPVQVCGTDLYHVSVLQHISDSLLDYMTAVPVMDWKNIYHFFVLTDHYTITIIAAEQVAGELIKETQRLSTFQVDSRSIFRFERCLNTEDDDIADVTAHANKDFGIILTNCVRHDMSYYMNYFSVMLFYVPTSRKFITPFTRSKVDTTNFFASFTLVARENALKITIFSTTLRKQINLSNNGSMISKIPQNLCNTPCLIGSNGDFDAAMVLQLRVSAYEDSTLISQSVCYLIPCALFFSEYTFVSPKLDILNTNHYVSLVARQTGHHLITLDSKPLTGIEWHYAECVDLWMVGSREVEERQHHMIGPVGSEFGCYVYGKTMASVYASYVTPESSRTDQTSGPPLSEKIIRDHKSKCFLQLLNKNYENQPTTVTQKQHVCPKEFLGKDCTYKCRCKDLKCKDSYKCFQSGCKDGYFGPYCLYRDALPLAEKVEGFNLNTSTCMETDRVDIVFKESIFFNFLWISSDRNVSEITNFAIVLMPDGKQTIECLNQTSKVVDGSAMKIWCLNRVDAKNISIKFEKRYRLCQLYVNGGRNLAPAGKAEMLFDGVKDDNIGWSANNPVNQRLEGSESCKLIMVFNESTKWALVFQPPVEIYSIRLVIESEGLTYTGFQLRLQSSDHTTDFVYNSTTEFQAEHNIKVHNASRIERAEFLVKTSLFLCKFEVFGDCPRTRYGLNCDETCSQTCHRDRCNFDGTCIRCNMFRYGPHCLLSTRNWAFNNSMSELSESSSRHAQTKLSSFERNYFRILPLTILFVAGFIFVLYNLIFKKRKVVRGEHDAQDIVHESQGLNA